jgi:two-component system response regulator YesN
LYKVLIIDDEVLVRIGLKTTIDWEKIGFIVVGEASNGEQGFEQYKKHKPDVIITDIKMPKKDGLWLIQEIRKENKDEQIMVLTCFDEFSYVREALKIGANEYILKSEVEDEELKEVMESIKNKLDEKNKITKTQNSVKINSNSIKRSLLNDMIKTDFDFDDKIIERCAEVGFPISNTKFSFVNFVISEDTIENIAEEKSLRRINNAIVHIIMDQMIDKGIEFIYNNSIKKYIFFMSSSTLNMAELNRIFISVCNATKQYFNIDMNIVYTNPFEDINNVPNVYNQCMEKAQILFYNNKKACFIVNTDDISFEEANVFDLKKQYSKIFNEYIGQENVDNTEKLIYEVADYFKKNSINTNTVKIFYSNLLGDIFNTYKEFFEDNEQIMEYEYYHYKIMNSENLKSIVKLLLDFTGKVIQEIAHLKYSNSKLIVSRALNYIENNYYKKISLEDVASELSLSKHYLCNVFKKEKKETMSLYINKLRIEKAKKMLLKTDCKSKEIFEEVGYSNQQYFSKVFKKITGMTIVEHRESMNNSK